MRGRFFDQAVSLAGAFVANGDIRLMGDTNEGTVTQQQLSDLIQTLYRTLEETYETLQEDAPPGMIL